LRKTNVVSADRSQKVVRLIDHNDFIGLLFSLATLSLGATGTAITIFWDNVDEGSNCR